MKWNWGTGIAIFYTTFVIVMVAMVVSASRKDVNMVQDNYYDKDLHYEAFRQSRENSRSLPLRIEWNAAERHIQIHFPDDMQDLSGSVTLYRPSDRRLDRIFMLNHETPLPTLKLPAQGLPAGMWRIMIDWQSAGVPYYKEEILVL